MPVFPPIDDFPRRHIALSAADIGAMTREVGAKSLDDLINHVVPAGIRLKSALNLPPARSEREALEDLAGMAAENEVWRSYLGLGYHDTITPGVVLRNILENPGWYTAYTPYQAEISQGRLEMLLNYQTMIRDLTGMEIANASLLDEGTAAAEAMTMSHRISKRDSRTTWLVSDQVHPQTIAVVRVRAEALGLTVRVENHAAFRFDETTFGCLVQYPATDGAILDYAPVCAAAHAAGAFVTAACDLLALTVLRAPAEFGADIAIGNSQRFGVPLGYGGPHAAFMATKQEYVRSMPGRLIGLSKDRDGNPALRMALATREQHIRREKATSNICTAQVLLAVTAAGYAIYHGPDGLRKIAGRLLAQAGTLREAARRAGHDPGDGPVFDTVAVRSARAGDIVRRAAAKKINLRSLDDRTVVIALDETVGDRDMADLLEILGCTDTLDTVARAAGVPRLPAPHARSSAFLSHEVFHRHHSEHDMLRYLHKLEVRDFTLNAGMIPLGSCTMKLNATAEMIPVTLAGFGRIHPFAPHSQAKGYQRLFRDLESWLSEITGFDATSLQPNAGSQGEYAGLLVIRAYHQSRNEGHRNVCLIPHSAHGTNPASAVMAGMTVVVVECDDDGNINVEDLLSKCREHAANLACLMVTYPSTHGVFEEDISEICRCIHDHGGQVYMDGANMNAQVGLTNPGLIGADVCHLNLHKTFCIPHGGGGPGMGPICVRKHLAPFLPGHPLARCGGERAIGPVSAAPWGSASILPISWAYIAMMGAEGLTMATKAAILSANYVAKKLAAAYPTLYVGRHGYVAHECILDPRPLQKTAHVQAEDIAKRLMDYGFHAPTLSFPVAGTLMVEPTESEPRAELDRFIEAMLAIREEAREIESGRADEADNVLRNAPHTAACALKADWPHPYSRERAVFPSASARESKYWPTVRRVDGLFGDRNLVCACGTPADYAEPPPAVAKGAGGSKEKVKAKAKK
ncbi:MAG: aminomethyl-transferring glycine dehydrogenase [Candidatus Brocadiae bacterium]|nr:aminomethyl-transferring glycine dehydrogenase [Candidatus Brocadiia bacterium]